MQRDEREPPVPPQLPLVMFLPLAAAPGDGWHGVDAGVLARRLPDFVHQVLNQGQPGPTGMLEVQSPPEEGPVVWVLMDTPPEPEEAFDLLPDDGVRAVVTGELMPVPDGFRVEFLVYCAEDAQANFTSKVGGTIQLDDPVPGLLQLARRLARLLELPFQDPPRGLLTRNGKAFLAFLQGLDNAMLLSGDLQIEVPDDREQLMRPFAEALALDPGFGLALRVAHSTAALALYGSRLDQDSVRRFLDRCYSAQPFDGEACVAVAEQLSDMGDDQRAIAWLQHASSLDPPPARGLENLGIIFANRGDTIAARRLWQRGVDVDGHPDFFAHLARLHFGERREHDAWELIQRGLRRLHERIARPGEWEEHDRGAGVLLHYVHEHLGERKPPAIVVASLLHLRSMLDGEDQVHLGCCLCACGHEAAGRAELVAALAAGELPPDTRDQAVRALLNLDVHGFERRFAKAADQAMRGRKPRGCLRAFQRWLDLQPEFWPARFFMAIAQQRMGEEDAAMELLETALQHSPAQPDVLHRMAQLFDRRGNPKRALELIDEALVGRPDDPKLLAGKVQFLLRLDRLRDAQRILAQGLALAANDHDLLKLKKRFDA